MIEVFSMSTNNNFSIFSEEVIISPIKSFRTSSERLGGGVIQHENVEYDNNMIVSDERQQQLVFFTDEEEDQRQMDEEQSSLELARQLMAEEAMYSYQQHIELLRDSAHEYSQEDLDAFRTAMGVGEEEQEDQYAENAYEEEPSYETMLLLSERIGDVKTERWNMIATKEIEKLPTFQFDDTTSNNSNNVSAGSNNTINEKTRNVLNDSENKCLVCQCHYELNETIIQLPCNHCFHHECASQWLLNKDNCPYCRQCIK